MVVVIDCRLRASLLTDLDGVDHIVTDDDFIAGRGQGSYFGLCGTLFDVAPMIEGPDSKCWMCVGVLRGLRSLKLQAAQPNSHRGRHRRARGFLGWWRAVATTI